MREQFLSMVIEGYRDGADPNSPEPSANRSHSYRHGFRMGRNDLHKSPGRGASAHRDEAAAADSHQ